MVKCEVIEKRESIRLYDTSKKIELCEISGCIEAAAKAPSPYNKQPWEFRIINSQETIEELAALLPHNRWIKTAPTVVVVGTEKVEGIDKLKYYLAVGAAIENMMLEAQQRGISTCWVAECMGKGFEEKLLWPKEGEIVSIVAMGFSRRYQTKREIKKSVSEILV